MFQIVDKEVLGPAVKRLVIKAPDIAAKASPGQFVVVRIDQTGERIPLTIADSDKQKGLISLIFQEVGFTTIKLGRLNKGDSLLDVLGPLGHPAAIIPQQRDPDSNKKRSVGKKYGTVICVAGGVGVAEVLPVAKALKNKGNKIIGIIGARSKELIILEEPVRTVCDKFYLTTDDGSYGKKGLVTDVLNDVLSQEKVDLVYAIGPVAMMEAVANLTKGFKVKTTVSLNPIMVDATGMCGSCRVTIGGRVKFCCVDGPDFDAHQVDFKELSQRLKLFKEQELSIHNS